MCTKRALFSAAAAAAAAAFSNDPWPLLCRAGDEWTSARCPATATCSPMAFSATRTGCCPWPNATNCAGALECCPAGTVCVPTGDSPPFASGAFMCQQQGGGANVSVSRAPCKPGPSQPMNGTLANVLVIGDSVSIGYLGWLAYLLADVALVQHAPWEYLPGQGGDGGAEEAEYGDQCLDYWLRSPSGLPYRADLVMFNFGIHNMGQAIFPGQAGLLSNYKGALANITAKLRAYASATGAQLLFATTTAQMCSAASDIIVNGTINPQAAEVMAAANVPVVDLHAAIVAACGPSPNSTCLGFSGCWCPHCANGGYEWLANTTIAPAIRKMLAAAAAPAPAAAAEAAAPAPAAAAATTASPNKFGIGVYNDTLHCPTQTSQLPVAANLTGAGGWVLLFFETLDPNSPATFLPTQWQQDLLAAAYAAGLRPIVRLGQNARNYRNFSDEGPRAPAHMHYSRLAQLYRGYVAALPLPPGGSASGDALHVQIGNEFNICVEWDCYTHTSPALANASQWSAEVAAFTRDVFAALRPLPGLALAVSPMAPSGPGGCSCGNAPRPAAIPRHPQRVRAAPPPPLTAASGAPAEFPPAGCSGRGAYPAGAFGGTGADFITYMLACEPGLFATADFFASHPYPGCNEDPLQPCALAGLTGYRPEHAAAIGSWLLNPAHAAGQVFPVVNTETSWWGSNETAKAAFMVRAFEQVWLQDANVTGVTPFLLAGGHWDVDGFTWTRWDRDNETTLTLLEPIYLAVQQAAARARR